MFYLPSRLRIRNLNATAYDVTYANQTLTLPASTTTLTEVTERFALFTEQEWNAMRVDHVDTGNVEFSWENIPLYSLYSCPVLFDADAVVGGSDTVEVYNESGARAAGDIVYLSGWDQTRQRFNIALADADSVVVGARRAQYILPAAIANNAAGSASKRFRLTAVDVSAGAEGDPVYLSTTAGGWTLTAPVGADDSVQVIGRVAVVGVAGPPATGVIEFNVGAASTERIAGRDIVPGALSADALGRALMATGFFDQVKALDAFGADSIDNAVLLDAVADGAFVADAATRALFANDFVTPALIDEAAAFVWTGNQTFSGGLFNTRRNIVFADSPYTPAATDNVILVDTTGGAITIAPTQVANRILLVKVINATAATTITPTAGLIDGQASWVSPIGARTSALLISDGTNMHVLTATLLNTALGRAHMADDFFTTAEMVAGAGGKFAPGAFDTVALANVLADDAFTSVEVSTVGAGGKFAASAITTAATAAGGLFAAGSLDTGGLTNVVANDGITAAVWEAKAAVGAISASVDGRASLADDFFTTAEFVAGAGGKFAPDCLDNVAVRNVFAADAFGADADSRGAFITDFIDAATADDIIATDALGEDLLTANELTARTSANTVVGAGVVAGGTRALDAAEFGLTTTVALVINDGASNTYSFTGMPYRCRVIDAWSVNTAAGNVGNTYLVGAGGVAITDAFASAGGVRDIGRAGEIDTVNHVIAAAGELRVTTVRAGGSSAAIVYVTLMRVP